MKNINLRRRNFCSIAAGLPFILPSALKRPKKEFKIQPYRQDKTLCPVFRVTPKDGIFIHTFFDRSPLSPCGRYILCLRMPFQERRPKPGEKAEICLINLEKETLEVLYETTGWDVQTAAHQQWGPSGKYVYFNDVIDDQVVIVKYNVNEHTYERFEGSLYQISPDERFAASVDLREIGKTQGGYGVIVDPEKVSDRPQGASEAHGLWVTDLKTGERKLLVNMAECFELLPNKDQYKDGTFFGFHVKYNRQGTRMMLVVRNRPPEGGYEPSLVTFKPDGSDLRLALKNEIWSRGGHHPDWHPDGEHITHNIKIDGTMRFCQYKYDGSDFHALSDTILGGGHPSFHKDGRYMVSDAYVGEPVVPESKEVPIRWIDMEEEKETALCHIWTFGEHRGVLRCDPHPVWSFDFSKICFNGAPNDRKSVFLADVSSLL